MPSAVDEARISRPLTEEQLQQRRIVGVHPETVTDVAANDIPGHYPNHDDSWSLQHFKDNVHVNFHQNKQYDAQFSLVGVDASIANAYRRILVSEIPTLAIEDVYMFDNTTIIQDEVLCHRLGLIPLTAGSEALKWLRWFKKPPRKDDYNALQSEWEEGEDDDSDKVPSDVNTIVMNLEIECRWATMEEDGRDGKALAKAGSTDPEERYVNSNVYASALTYEPQGQQAQIFAGEAAVKVVNPKILVAKLRPGQRIHCRMHCVKGIGADHAKFSPVATASYRLLPHINITHPITGADAKKFQRCFPRGVIGLEDDATSGEKKAVVKDAMKDTVSRECLRHEEFQGKVKLGRIRDHFIFSVESTGQFDSDTLFLESVAALKGKAQRFKRHLTALEEGN